MTQLTVGIPVFNAMPYLPESMESILRQRYTDFSILVINDGSTDGSLEYLQSLRDSRVRVVSQKNCGLTATLNRMLAEIKTPWLVRFDSDDVAYPERLALTAEYIGRYPQAGMFYSMAEYYPRTSVGLFRSTKGTPAEIRKLVQTGRIPSICHPTVTLNVEKTIALGGYRFDLHVEDIDLWWRMALKCDIQMIPEVTLGFRQNTKSVSSANLETQALNTLYVQYLLLSHLRNRPPLSYQDAKIVLASILNRPKLRFKQHLRASNIALGNGDRLLGAREACRALLASPVSFANRLLDECFPRRSIGVGESVRLMARQQSNLWPSEEQPTVNTSAESEHNAAIMTAQVRGEPLS